MEEDHINYPFKCPEIQTQLKWIFILHPGMDWLKLLLCCLLFGHICWWLTKCVTLVQTCRKQSGFWSTPCLALFFKHASYFGSTPFPRIHSHPHILNLNSSFFLISDLFILVLILLIKRSRYQTAAWVEVISKHRGRM